jgi:hypothetical protein
MMRPASAVGKRKPDVLENYRGLKLVKRFGSSQGSANYEGTVTRLGVALDGKTVTAEVLNEDGDDEVVLLAEVDVWRRKALVSTNVQPEVQLSLPPPKRAHAGLTPAKLARPAASAALSVAKPRHDAPRTWVPAAVDDNDLGSWRNGLVLLGAAAVLTVLLGAFPAAVDRRLRWSLWPLVSGGVMMAGKLLVGF